MRNPFQFSKPKGPGFGINKAYYLSALLPNAELPSIAEVVMPKGNPDMQSEGPLQGFGVPLVADKNKDRLELPMQRGQYAIASYDRKTVLRLRILLPSEAGFNPELIFRSSFANEISSEARTRLSQVGYLCQFTFESHDPDVYPSLDFLHGVLRRLTNLRQGVIADPLAERYLLPEQLFVHPRADQKVDGREHIHIRIRPDLNSQTESWHVSTKGLFKFVLPELEILQVPIGFEQHAAKFLLRTSQGILSGFLVQNGSLVGDFEARTSSTLGGNSGVPTLELLPPTGRTVRECLERYP